MTWARADLGRYLAWLFDLDGVLTDTARIHALAWQATFDEFLRGYAQRTTTAYQPFDPNHDYEAYVDGKPRYDGVRDFLAARHIPLPYGQRSDSPDRETVCGLGNRKHRLVHELLTKTPVAACPGARELLAAVRATGARTAVVSASEDAKAVLANAGLAELFDATVDGHTAREHSLAGKPEPATYQYAAAVLGTTPGRAVVVEDAPAGVAAGRAGHFGLVIGVARRASAAELAAAGADLVVGRLGELLQPGG